MPSLLAAAFVGVMALGSAAGGSLLAGAVIVGQVVLTLGAVRLVPVPAASRAAWLALATGVTATAWVAWRAVPDLTPMATVLGPALLVAVLLQLWRRDGRTGATESLSLAVAACALAVLPVAWVSLRFAEGGAYSVGIGLLGVGVAALAEALRVSPTLRRLLAVLVASVGAAGLVAVLDDTAANVPPVAAVVIAAFGALLAVCAFAGIDRIAAEGEPRADGPAPPGAGVHVATGRSIVTAIAPLRISLPVAAAAPVVYVLGRILVG